MTILDFLSSHWLYDMQVMSKWWVWVPILPAMFYLAFMAIKWGVFTLPIWLPLRMILSVFKSNEKEESES